MELLAYPPRRMWVALAERLAVGSNAVCADRAVVDSLMQAFTSLYQVQSHLWAIPDKAMSARGVSLTVSRTPVRAATLILRPDMPLAAAASMVCAAKAVGVGELSYVCDGPLSPELVYILKDVPRTDSPAACEVSVPEQALRSCNTIAIAADFTSDVSDVARDAATAHSLGYQVMVVTNSPALASALTTELSGRVTIILMDVTESINAIICELRPGLIVDERESARQNVESYFTGGNLLLGPLPEVNGAEALLMLAAPIIPIHTLTEALLTIDPLLTR